MSSTQPAAAVPMDVVNAMRAAFIAAAKHNNNNNNKSTQEMQIGMLRVANRNLHCAQTRAALLDCIVASVAPLVDNTTPKQIDWLNARFVPQPPSPPAADIDKWVELALHEQQDCDDDLVQWLVCTVGAVVTERALEYACRANRWRTALPILLSSLNISVDDEDNFVLVLRDSRLYSDQLLHIPQMFQAKGYTLRLSRLSWAISAATAYRDRERVAELRAILEPLLFNGTPTWEGPEERERLRIARLCNVAEMSLAFPVDLDEEDAHGQHLKWMDLVLTRLPYGQPTVVY